MNETTERFRSILQRLLERSRKDQVHWHRKTIDDVNTIKVWFPDQDTEILVTYVSPAAAPDWAYAELVVNDDTVAKLEAEDSGDSKDFNLLSELWHDAHRKISGWDKALEKLEHALQSDEAVGSVAPF